jgi:glycosyltransferase involved in cell wall biosynthesis
MKVVHVIPSLVIGGAEMMLLKLLETMDRHLFQPEVVTLLPGGEGLKRCQTENIPVHDLGMNRRWPSPTVLVTLGRLARRLEPDMVQGWMYHGNLVSLVLARFAPGRPRLIWNVRHAAANLTRDKRTTRLTLRLGGLLSGFPDRIIFNSSASLDQHAVLGYRREKCVLIPNGFDLERFHPSPSARTELRRELDRPPGTRLIGVAGRWHPVKGHEVFLAAAARLANDHPDLAFVLVGRGAAPDNPQATELVRNHGLESRVHLLGHREDMPHVLAGLDLLVNSSFGEAFPNVLGEAMACGVPCVATDVGDSQRILAETGRIVQPGDSAALAGAMGEMLDLPAEARAELGQRCRRRIQEEYSLDRIAQQYADLYRSTEAGRTNQGPSS